MTIEELLRQERTRSGSNPLAGRVDDLVATVRRRRRLRAVGRAAAGAAAAVAVVLGARELVEVAPDGVAPARPVPTPAVTAPAPVLDLTSGWSSQAPFVAVDGVPYVGTDPWPQVEQIGSFTVVPTGVVYIDRSTGEIVREDWQHRTLVIGRQPWHPEPDTSYGGVRAAPWGQHRDLVGSPSEDLVAWVERDGDRRGDLVVVRPSTGAVLARTVVPGSPELPVIIAGIDARSVTFAVPSDGSVVDAPASRDVWSWDWAAGTAPRSGEALGDVRVADVSGGVWAVYDFATLEFRTSDGEVLSEAPSSYGDRTFFGSALSPDGRFWYGPAYLLILDTTTGARIPTVPWTIRYGWTGPSRLTLIGLPLTVCDAVLGTCTDPVPIPVHLSCAARTEYCGYDLPAY